MNKYFKNEPLWNLFSEALEGADTAEYEAIRSLLGSDNDLEFGRKLRHLLEKYWDEVEEDERFAERLAEETHIDVPWFFQEQAS